MRLVFPRGFLNVELERKRKKNYPSESIFGNQDPGKRRKETSKFSEGINWLRKSVLDITATYFFSDTCYVENVFEIHDTTTVMIEGGAIFFKKDRKTARPQNQEEPENTNRLFEYYYELENLSQTAYSNEILTSDVEPGH